MANYPKVSFDNTEIAFQYKSDQNLKDARRLFSLMGNSLLVKMGTKVTPWAIRSGLPIKGLIKNTIFKQFAGGQTLVETAQIANRLGWYNVQVILDYGVEGGDDSEQEFERSADQFIKAR